MRCKAAASIYKCLLRYSFIRENLKSLFEHDPVQEVILKIMSKRISHEERARKVKRTDFDLEKIDVSGKQILRTLESDVEKDYNNM